MGDSRERDRLEIIKTLSRLDEGLMSEEDPTAYIFGSTLTEQQLLVAQAQELDQQARWLVDHIGIHPGSRQYSAPETIISEMVTLVRPGGMVAVEEVDHASWLCHPPHASWDTLVQTYHSAFRANGGNVSFGRRLPELLRLAGLEDVQCKVPVDTVQPDAYRRKHLLSLLQSLRD